MSFDCNLTQSNQWFVSSLYCIHSFIPDIPIAPLRVHFYSRLQHWCCVGVKTPKRCRQLWVKDLPKVPTWRVEWDSNLRPSGRKAPNLPLSHHAPSFTISLLYSIIEVIRPNCDLKLNSDIENHLNIMRFIKTALYRIPFEFKHHFRTDLTDAWKLYSSWAETLRRVWGMKKISQTKFFLVIDSILSVFCLSLLSDIWYIFITYMTLFLTKSLYFRKNFSLRPFLSQFVLCLTSSNSTSRNIGGTDAWAVPHLKFL